MANNSSKAQQLIKLVDDLRRERQEHARAIAEIDSALAGFDVTAISGPTAPKRGRPRKNAAAAAVQTAPKSKGKSKRAGRGSYKETATDFILGLLNKPKKTAEINEAWKKSGRKGLANNTLTLLSKTGLIKRENIEGARGSQYSRA